VHRQEIIDTTMPLPGPKDDGNGAIYKKNSNTIPYYHSSTIRLNVITDCFDVQVIALHGLHARSRSLFGRNVIFCAQRFNCSINDLIYGHLHIIINSYVRNSVDETTLDHVAFLRELIMIRDSSLLYQVCYLATS